jgi:ABC-2 type transport system permease protein
MIDLITLTSKEVSRFLRIWKQTLLPPIITIVLYLLIFGKFIGEKITIVE